jgi:AAA family ATP:ADP antiporter
VNKAAGDERPERRALAAQALAIVGDQGTEILHRLLEDPDASVVAAACRAAGLLKSRAYLYSLVKLLPNPHLRGEAVDALAAYGPRISGSLGDILEDRTMPERVRQNIPRILKWIPDQRSVDVLLKATLQSDGAVRDNALKALNRLRSNSPRLHFEAGFITPQIMTEARTYFEVNAALEAVRRNGADGAHPHASLLARSLEERLHKVMDRLFRLLALEYPPKEIYSAYLAVSRGRPEEVSASLEFLDNVLDREVKRIVIPIIDTPAHLAQRGKEFFGVETKNLDSALRGLIQAGDPWLAPCATAAAVELNLRAAQA